MSTVGMVLAVSFFLLFLAIGIVFLCGKGVTWIAGYKDMEPEERAQYDVRKLTRAMGFLMISIAVLMPSFVCVLDTDAWMLWLIPLAISALCVIFSFKLIVGDYVKADTD